MSDSLYKVNDKGNTGSLVGKKVHFDYDTLDCFLAISRGSESGEYQPKKMFYSLITLEKYGLIRENKTGIDMTDYGKSVIQFINETYDIKRLHCLALIAREPERGSKLRTVVNERLGPDASILDHEGKIYRAVVPEENPFRRHMYYHTLIESGDTKLNRSKGIYQHNARVDKENEDTEETTLLEIISRNNGTIESISATVEDYKKYTHSTLEKIMWMEKNSLIRINTIIDNRAGLVPEFYFICTPKVFKENSMETHDGLDMKNKAIVKCLEMSRINETSPKYTLAQLADTDTLIPALVLEKEGFLKRKIVPYKVALLTDIRYKIKPQGKKELDSAIAHINESL